MGTLDEALERLSGAGPEWRGGLSNHGPMASEALVRMGQADAVMAWVDGYLPLLEEAPRGIAPVSDESWREALKLTEACLREYASNPSPLFLHAAGRGSALLGRR